MIAVDTNVLLRWLLDDDPRQSARAGSLFDANDEILVTDVVLAETVWVLSGKRYKVGASVIEEVVTGLLEDAHIVFEDAAVVWSALQDFADASNASNFADFLIIHKGKASAAHLDVPFKGMYTFDEALLPVHGVNSL